MVGRLDATTGDEWIEKVLEVMDPICPTEESIPSCASAENRTFSLDSGREWTAVRERRVAVLQTKSRAWIQV